MEPVRIVAKNKGSENTALLNADSNSSLPVQQLRSLRTDVYMVRRTRVVFTVIGIAISVFLVFVILAVILVLVTKK